MYIVLASILLALVLLKILDLLVISWEWLLGFIAILIILGILF